jgi:BASS family bile acid:Na+ symporter
MFPIIVKYTVMSSVVLLMLGVGFNTDFRDVIKVGRQVRLLARGLLANFVIVPVLMYLSILWLPISPDVKIGIMLMAAAPVAPMAPPFVGMAKGDLPYSVGLMVIVALLSVPLTPLLLSLSLPKSEEGLVLNPWQIIQTLMFVQLIPIGAAMGVRQARPLLADRLLKFVPTIGQVGLLIGVGLLLAAQAKQIHAIEPTAYLVLAALVAGSLFVGDWMMVGETAERRRALAVSTAIRNIPLAFLIANESFPGTPVAPVTLVFAVFTMVLSVAYGKLMTAGGVPEADSSDE